MFLTPSNHFLESLKNDLFTEPTVQKSTQKSLFKARPHSVCFPSISFSFEDTDSHPFLKSLIEERERERASQKQLITPRNSKKQRSYFSFESESIRNTKRVTKPNSISDSQEESESSFLETNANSIYEKSCERNRKIKKRKKIQTEIAQSKVKSFTI